MTQPDLASVPMPSDGYPPTLREIGRELAITSTNGVNDHLRALERKGYLHREGATARSLRPLNPLRVTPQQSAARIAESALAELQESLSDLEALDDVGLDEVEDEPLPVGEVRAIDLRGERF